MECCPLRDVLAASVRTKNWELLMPKLIFTSGAIAGQSYDLIIEKTTVGRSDHNTLVLHDPSLSAAHCEILMYGDEVIVRDLDSRNGTFVNGVALHNSQAPLKHGQLVRFGSVEARLELDGESEDSTASDITAVYAFGRAQRDQRREEQNPKPADPVQHLGPRDLGTEQKTMLVSQSPSQPPITAKPAPSPAPPPAKKRGFPLWVLVVAAIVVVVIAWRLLSR
jgi:predicted component of type VI protein secretion system